MAGKEGQPPRRIRLSEIASPLATRRFSPNVAVSTTAARLPIRSDVARPLRMHPNVSSRTAAGPPAVSSKRPQQAIDCPATGPQFALRETDIFSGLLGGSR